MHGEYKNLQEKGKMKLRNSYYITEILDHAESEDKVFLHFKRRLASRRLSKKHKFVY